LHCFGQNYPPVALYKSVKKRFFISFFFVWFLVGFDATMVVPEVHAPEECDGKYYLLNPPVVAEICQHC
jgi:hypothetical protein